MLKQLRFGTAENSSVRILPALGKHAVREVGLVYSGTEDGMAYKTAVMVDECVVGCTSPDHANTLDFNSRSSMAGADMRTNRN